MRFTQLPIIDKEIWKGAVVPVDKRVVWTRARSCLGQRVCLGDAQALSLIRVSFVRQLRTLRTPSRLSLKDRNLRLRVVHDYCSQHVSLHMRYIVLPSPSIRELPWSNQPPICLGLGSPLDPRAVFMGSDSELSNIIDPIQPHSSWDDTRLHSLESPLLSRLG